jgi:hypothetical protein
MAENDDGFLSRWSKRKAAAHRGVAQTDPPAPVPATPVPMAPLRTDPLPVRAEPVEALHRGAPAERTEPAGTPPPTLADVAQLTKDSDFKRFVAADVDPSVKNAALRKLFACDPHFNTMDGLDVYIDDYSKFEPVPRSLLRQLVNARAMGLLDDELPEQPRPDNFALDAPDDENADLQLQPDDAAGHGEPRARVAGSDEPAEPAAPDAVPPRSA